jgi:hypothetical protein
MKVPSEFIVYRRTGNGINEPVLSEDSMLRNLEWFDFWVMERQRRCWRKSEVEETFVVKKKKGGVRL